ncbi:MAG: cytochrome d ubiquinol oxidase subunit II [Vicinamibacterales bacterium]
MINEVWFVVLASMLTGYAVLDGFDLGVGALHLFVARTREERKMTIEAIGPVWNGNEVWLLAAGGSMVVAFPHLYASAFSGFYLALMIVLWLLVLRGLGIEFRHQLQDPLWEHAWDVSFAASSALLSLVFGVALGNVLRGVPFDANGEFQGSFALLLNPFALACGLLAVAVLLAHGGAYLALKTTGPVAERARRAVGATWWAVATLLAVVTAASFLVHPDFTSNFASQPALMLLPAAAAASLAAVAVFNSRRMERRTFQATSALIVFVLASVAAGLFPQLLPAISGSQHEGLDIYNAASPPRSLWIALGIYLVGLALVTIYLTRIYIIWGGKVRPGASYDA